MESLAVWTGIFYMFADLDSLAFSICEFTLKKCFNWHPVGRI